MSAKAKTRRASKRTKSNAPAAVAESPAKVLVLRTCKADMSSSRGFRWPESGPVEAPDWKPNAECGNGLHGWLWGQGDWRLQVQDAARWLVVEVDAASVVNLSGKVKFPRGVVLATFGHWRDAMAFIRERRPFDQNAGASATGYSGHASATGDYGHASATGYSGHASATGDSGHASATGYSGHASATGYSGHASATGDSGHASATGDYGHASATGDYGHASATGDYGHASATGYSGHASATGYSGWAVAGIGGVVKSGNQGAITLLRLDEQGRKRVVVAYVGENGIKPDTWYRLNEAGQLVEVQQ